MPAWRRSSGWWRCVPRTSATRRAARRRSPTTRSTSEGSTVRLPCFRRAMPPATTATAPARSMRPTCMTSRAERRRAVAAALLLGIACLTRASALAAQDEGNPWRVSDFPYLMGDPTNGLLVIGHVQYAKEADYDARVPYDGYLGLEAGWGTRSSRFLTLKYRAPTLYKGWRLAGDAGAVREGRFGYFGQGDGGQGSGIDPDDDHADRVHRTRYFGRAEVTRTLAAHLALAGAAGITHYRYQGSADGDQFHADFGDAALSGTDATGRVSLIFDTRRNAQIGRASCRGRV